MADSLIQTLAKLAIRKHYYCDDRWFSCPKAPEGCADDRQGNECNCGADEHNEKVLDLINNNHLETNVKEQSLNDRLLDMLSKKPSATDELLNQLHEIHRCLSEMVPKPGINGSRKVVQIATTQEVSTASNLLYALCDDGSLWWITPQRQGWQTTWRKVCDIPQENTDVQL